VRTYANGDAGASDTALAPVALFGR
jgi:hypothetical protein